MSDFLTSKINTTILVVIMVSRGKMCVVIYFSIDLLCSDHIQETKCPSHRFRKILNVLLMDAY